jgi:hypothetical protein
VKVAVALVGLVLGLLVAGCMGESQTYGEEEVIAAFEQNGMTLSENTRPERSGEFLSTDPPLYVRVGTASEADDLWSSPGDLNLFARRANVVVVIVGDDLAAPDQERVVTTLEALPESDAEVELASG